MFPLGTVLFPGQVLPLHVFEQRYRVLMRECLAGERRFGVVLIERGLEVGGGDTRFGVGTVAEIAESAEFPDGRFALLAVGTARVQVVEWMADDPYPQALAAELPEGEPAGRAKLEAAEQAVRRALALLAELGMEQTLTPGASLSADPSVALWQLCALAPLGSFDRQRLLEASGSDERAALVAELSTAAAELFGHRLAEGP